MSDGNKSTPQAPAGRRRGGRKAVSSGPSVESAGAAPQFDQPLSHDEDVLASARVIAAVPFDFQEKPIRTVTENGQVWFVAEDVCCVLEHSNSRMAVGRLDDDESRVNIVYTPGGPQRMNTINESGLFQLVSTSPLPKAKAFRRWVTGVVLPTLRRTGRFDMGIEANRTIKTAADVASDNPNRITVPLPGPGRYLVVLFPDGERRIEQLSFSDSVSALAALDCRSVAYTHLTAAALWEKLQHVRSLKGDLGEGFTFDKLSATMQAGADLARQILYTYDEPILTPRKAAGVAAQ